MFPDTPRLQRLLDYLSIRPQTNLVSLDEAQIFDPAAGRTLTQNSLNKIEHIRKTVYSYKNYNQIGLFEFQVGLLMMEQGWYSEAAESFEKAARLWSFMPERPNICLANFAKGVAHHRNRRFELAETTYSKVQEEVDRIRNEVNVPTTIPQFKKYQDFVKDLAAQLNEAQKTVSRDILYDLSPHIHPSLQADTQHPSSPHSVPVNNEILQANILRHFSMPELKSLCYKLKIDFNALEGIDMPGKVWALIIYCQRNHRMASFLDELRKNKPSVVWDEDKLQPSPDDEIVTETGSATFGFENITDAPFEEITSPEEGLEFIRKYGEVHFGQDDDWTRPYSSKLIVVNIELSGNYEQFSLEKQVEFIDFLSRITFVDPDQITIKEAKQGSIKVTLEMPETSAKLLIDMLLEEDPILKNFRILKVELGKLSAPPKFEDKPSSMDGRLWEQATSTTLGEFIFLYFNENELRELSLDVAVEYGRLSGQGKRVKAKELAAFCSRHSKFPRLAQKCQELRPHAFKQVFSNL